MKALWRKLTTKPIWYLERHRNYEIRQLSVQLPPVCCNPAGKILAILTTPATFQDAIWSGWSWLRFLSDTVQLRILVDGAVGKDDRALVSRLFPGAILSTASEQLQRCPVEGTNLNNFARQYKLGRKVSLVLSLQSEGPVLYSDYDVLVFGKPSELIQQMGSPNSGSCFNQQPLAGSFDPLMIDSGATLGLTCPAGFNSGLMWIPEGHLSAKLADRLLKDWKPDSTHAWFTEQTLLGLLLAEKGATPLPPDRYVVTMQRQFYWEPDVDYDSIAVRHFIYPVRHVMHMKGQPWLLSKAREMKS